LIKYLNTLNVNGALERARGGGDKPERSKQRGCSSESEELLVSRLYDCGSAKAGQRDSRPGVARGSNEHSCMQGRLQYLLGSFAAAFGLFPGFRLAIGAVLQPTILAVWQAPSLIFRPQELSRLFMSHVLITPHA